MAHDRTDDFVAKVKLIEERVGQRASYLILDPFDVDARDAVNVQAAARRIAEFVGLGQYRFIVGVCGQTSGVAGHIELNRHANDVFIEVSATLERAPAAILATLAHEITHKFLHVHGVSCGSNLADEYHNEILTDIASIWLGLGKLALNGCDNESVTVERTPDGTRTTTHQHRVGYLNRSDFAFVYLLICTMRGLSSSDYERGLTAAAVDAVRGADVRYRKRLDPNWRSIDSASGIRSRLERAIDNAQSACAYLRRDMTLLQRTCIDGPDSFLRDSHARLKSRMAEFDNRADDAQINPCLRFLHNLELDRFVSKSEREFEALARTSEDWTKALGDLLSRVRKMGGQFGAIPGVVVDTISCPLDGTVLRVDAVRNRFRVRCSVCGYGWIVETAVPASIAGAPEYDAPRRRPSWLRRFLTGNPKTEKRS